MPVSVGQYLNTRSGITALKSVLAARKNQALLRLGVEEVEEVEQIDRTERLNLLDPQLIRSVEGL